LNPILSVLDLEKTYRQSLAARGEEKLHRALSGVTFEVDRGESLGIFGESGAGKTTLARCILGLAEPSSGKVLFKGEKIESRNKMKLRDIRKSIQVIWQDPLIYLNPYMRAGEIVEEPLINYQNGNRAGRRGQVNGLFEMVGLSRSFKGRYPHEMSGGQCQRLAIARAIAPGPELLICDEAVSSLDSPMQIQILQLLKSIHSENGLTVIFISHDLALIRYFCNRIVVLHEGKVARVGSMDELIAHPPNPRIEELVLYAQHFMKNGRLAHQ